MRQLIAIFLLLVCVVVCAQTNQKLEPIILPISIVIDQRDSVDYNLVMEVYRKFSREMEEHVGVRTVLLRTPYPCNFDSRLTRCLAVAGALRKCGASLQNNYTKEGQKLNLQFSSAPPVDKNGQPFPATVLSCANWGAIDIRYYAQENFQTKAVGGILRALAKLLSLHLDSYEGTWLTGPTVQPGWTPGLEAKMAERMKLWMVQQLPESDPPKKP